MSEVPLVAHFPMISPAASIVDISTGAAFSDDSGQSSRLAKLVGRGDRAGPSYHWSSSIEGAPSWSIRDPDTEILHIRAHDCPHAGTPLHPTCHNCIAREFHGDVEFVFNWKAARAESLRSVSDSGQVRDSVPRSVDRVTRTADTPIKDIFDGGWTDVYNKTRFELGASNNLLLQHCGACPNPMDPRLQECASCVRSRSPQEGFPGADFILFVKMLRPEDGVEQRSGFPGVREGIRGRAAPPRFGPDPRTGRRGENNPDDTGNTRIFTG